MHKAKDKFCNNSVISKFFAFLRSTQTRQIPVMRLLPSICQKHQAKAHHWNIKQQAKSENVHYPENKYNNIVSFAKYSVFQ